MTRTNNGLTSLTNELQVYNEMGVECGGGGRDRGTIVSLHKMRTWLITLTVQVKFCLQRAERRAQINPTNIP